MKKGEVIVPSPGWILPIAVIAGLAIGLAIVYFAESLF